MGMTNIKNIGADEPQVVQNLISDDVIACCEAQEKEMRDRSKRKRRVMVVASHLFLAALVVIILLPGAKKVPSCVPLLVSVGFMELLYLSRLLGCGKDADSQQGDSSVSASWIIIIVWALLAMWDLATTKFAMMHPVLVPAPEAVFNVFATQWKDLLVHIGSSIQLLLMGAVTSIFAGVLLGAVVGWTPSLCNVLAPIARVLAPIPSIVFAPYLVALMPTFRLASATVIFLGLFWPTFLGTIVRVSSMDRRIIESARMLELTKWEMVCSVILPYLIPGVLSGLNAQLTSAIMMLTFAEMLGAKSGLGYYIINYTNFANYVNVLAGIITVGVVVTLLNWLINALKEHAIRWM